MLSGFTKLVRAAPVAQRAGWLRSAALRAASSAAKHDPDAPLPPPKGFAARAKPVKKKQKRRRRFISKPTDPTFDEVFKRFSFLVHPDLLRRHPELRETNDQSLALVREVLEHAKAESWDAHIPPRDVMAPFYLRTGTKDHFKKVTMRLKHAGGHFPHQMAWALSDLFKAADLPHQFQWDKHYWNRHKNGVRNEKDPEEEEGEADA